MPNDWKTDPPYPYDSKDKVDNPSHRARRQVIKGAIGAAVVAAVGYVSWTKFFFPPGSPVPFAGKSGTNGTSPRVDLGSVKKFKGAKAPVQVTVNNQIAFVEFSGAAPKVLSGICTHRGCPVEWDAKADHFLCPCHDSFFGLDGSVIQGPATLPLPLIPSQVDGDHLYAQPVTT